MIGLYYLALPTLCHEVGITEKGALKALARCSEGVFGYYDRGSEGVFVPEMAHYQIGPTLKPKDNRHKAVLKLLEQMRKSPFIKEFMARYQVPFQLPDLSPLQAPCKPLRSQDQDQVQEQEKDQEQEGEESSDDDRPTFEDLRARWNAIEGICKCKASSDGRLKAFRARVADPEWIKQLDDALAAVAKTPFCLGKNDRNWRADIDFFLRPDTFLHLFEGKYKGKPKGGSDDKQTYTPI
jgi:hypothetical protein